MDNLFLTGFMGSGKTAVGRVLAKRLHRPFVDLDAEIEKEAGLPVSEIFARFGEPEFRLRERRMLERVSTATQSVVATGGGAVVAFDNRRLMRSHGRIVCLAATPDDILQRVGDGTTRPLLAGEHDPEQRRAKVVRLLEERASAYADADHTVVTSGRPVSAIAEAILAWLGGGDVAVPAPTSARERGDQ